VEFLFPNSVLLYSFTHNGGILERQYWANQKKKELCKHEGENIDKEAGKTNKTQLKIPGHNPGGEEKYEQSSKKKLQKTKRSKSALLTQCSRQAAKEA